MDGNEQMEEEVPQLNTTSDPLTVNDSPKGNTHTIDSAMTLDTGTKAMEIPPKPHLKQSGISKLPIKGILKNPNRVTNSGGIILGSDQRKVSKHGEQSRRNQQHDLGVVWNIRGLNASIKQNQIRELIREHDLSVCAVLETHVHANALLDMELDVCTKTIVAWDVRRVNVMLLGADEQFMHCELRLHGLQEPFFCSFVYGANRSAYRQNLWSGLRRFKVLLNQKSWVVLGDFNTMLFPHDGFGGISRRNGDMLDFGACIEDIELYDVTYTGIQYTIIHGKPSIEGGILRKLDRVLANNEFTDMFRDCAVRFLPRGLSDHSPALLHFSGGQRRCVASFRFDNFLTNDLSFLNIVKAGWQVQVEGTFMFRVLHKLKQLKKPLRKLRSSYHNLSKRTASLKLELDVIQLACDLDPGNGLLQHDLEALRIAYCQACKNEDTAAKQRAKVRWLDDGDMNTKFFHQVLKERRHLKHIQSIANTAGVFVHDDEVPNAFIQHLKCYLDENLHPDFNDYFFPTSLPLAEALYMIRPISDEEIRTAMFQIGNDKAPGKAWGVVGPDITIAIHNFFYRGRLAKELNHTLLCMLPKSPNASMVSEFRPISCCSVIYKCISKVIVQRMKGCLDTLVGQYQLAFIPGRRIADNILMAHELVLGYNKKNGPPRCAFKSDIRKAYDMVDWRYLLNIMRGFGFHFVLCKWIEEMITTPTFSVTINGETYGFFHGKRGIWQGDPLSPYLFTLVMEGFSLIFKSCIEEAANFGYHEGCEQFGLTHLCFADDLFVFTRGDVQSVEILKKALQRFEEKSGLHANLEKSEIFFGNVPEDTRNAIKNCLPFRNGTFASRYLGVPLSPSRLKLADYGVLMMKIKSRIQNWKTKFLSYGGRRQLIISVLQSLQLYWMAIFYFPTSVVHEIECLFTDFLWSQGGSSKGKCRVAWSDVCIPFSAGGLGIKRLKWWNRALLAKHIWDLATQRQSLWGRWVKVFALRGGNVWTAHKSSRWSWVLSKMMELRPLLRSFAKVQIGDGSLANAWEDSWLPCGPLSAYVSARFIHNQGLTLDASVHDLSHTIDGAWPQSWIQRYDCLANHPFPNLVPNKHDVFSWENTHGLVNFSVRVAYDSLQGDIHIMPWYAMVWFKGHIPKHAFCMWVAFRLRHPTQDRMVLWKEVPPDLKCSLCQEVRDSHNHYFLNAGLRERCG
ncbi:LOW QUALITY PROTEIN: hypothetical protein OSB04_002827 [Centaurea solstitialis]|uniref:Reverse transcriptase domain-containing protein n=1 Tax=Centaurea solstitialis TaxID=347529 RepID=A0AA38U465_9ASTR|nr:LOW QUALITY PROTEIN: hypothetical protein OSB04_002827 [Centaurea solstitialis]